MHENHCGLFAILPCSMLPFLRPYATDWQVSESGTLFLIEAKTRIHKTAHVRRQNVFLPLVGLGRLFRDDSWAKCWMQLRARHLKGRREFVLPSLSSFPSGWTGP